MFEPCNVATLVLFGFIKAQFWSKCSMAGYSGWTQWVEAPKWPMIQEKVGHRITEAYTLLLRNDLGTSSPQVSRLNSQNHIRRLCLNRATWQLWSSLALSRPSFEVSAAWRLTLFDLDSVHVWTTYRTIKTHAFKRWNGKGARNSWVPPLLLS